MKEDRILIYFVAALMLLAALFLLFSTVLYIILPVPQNFLLLMLGFPGELLFRSFHVGAFLAGLFPAIAAIALIDRRRSIERIWLVVLLIVPFISAGLVFRLLFDDPAIRSPITDWARNSFGQNGATIIFSLLTLAQILAIFYLRPLRASKPTVPALIAPAATIATTDAQESPTLQVQRPENVFERLQRTAPVRSVPPIDNGQPHNGVADSDQSGQPAQAHNGLADNGSADNKNSDMPLVVHFSKSGFFSSVSADDDSTHNGTSGAAAPVEGALAVAPAPTARTDAPIVPTPAARAPLPEHALVLAAPLAAQPEAAAQQSYRLPIEGLLNRYRHSENDRADSEALAAAEQLRIALGEFNIEAEVTGIRRGPVITMFEILPAPGVKLARITNLSDNIALRLAAASVRIVAPIPGKHAVGIEIPNRRREMVSFAELVGSPEFANPDMHIPVALGRTVPGEARIVDLVKTPHLLIAGATGAGKSVCVNAIICSILYRCSPQETRLLLIDPKIVELKVYNDIPHLLTPVITDHKRALQALKYCIFEMERRYNLLESLGVRDIRTYNARLAERRLAADPLAYIVVIIDEYADLMNSAGKQMEAVVARLAAMSRAVGIHLVLATQRPSADVITGLIKANIPSRIAFMVAGKVDSRIILDAVGAEKLLGQGDMLFSYAAEPFPARIQGSFLSEEEVERVAAHVRELGETDYIDEEIFSDDEIEIEESEIDDQLMQEAIEIVRTQRKASASFLQRRLKIGYNRAARLVEGMEQRNIVGPPNGSKSRTVLLPSSN